MFALFFVFHGTLALRDRGLSVLPVSGLDAGGDELIGAPLRDEHDSSLPLNGHSNHPGAQHPRLAGYEATGAFKKAAVLEPHEHDLENIFAGTVLDPSQPGLENPGMGALGVVSLVTCCGLAVGWALVTLAALRDCYVAKVGSRPRALAKHRPLANVFLHDMEHEEVNESNGQEDMWNLKKLAVLSGFSSVDQCASKTVYNKRASLLSSDSQAAKYITRLPILLWGGGGDLASIPCRRGMGFVGFRRAYFHRHREVSGLHHDTVEPSTGLASRPRSVCAPWLGESSLRVRGHRLVCNRMCRVRHLPPLQLEHVRVFGNGLVEGW